MRNALTTFFIFYFAMVSFGQGNDEVLATIKDQIEIIEGYIEFDTFYLDPEEFLDVMADHGAELKGFYEHERLKKITKTVGTPSADVITVFYFWNDQLIYVNYKQRPYFETKNENGQVIMDYSNAFTKFESKHYYNNQNRIKKEEIGKPMKNLKPEVEFLDYAKKMKSLLDNKFYNRDTYAALQGKWVFVQNTDDYIIFEGTIRFNFYNGKFANRLKTKIEDNVLECWFPMDDRIYRYKIENIDESVLTLTDLFSKEEFMYAKIVE
ncbi:hypothetical protein [Aquimarina sp. 2201CG5-10]|uniref:hypothetical protein n=1 Tax=Aquimarina callyspongiae TaxID=3098150 RepID=UPI002AB58B53|nr:hypothetical protein [Aquimarina sp. 2201CG5-10]MDY8137831.1 hypothetical protein [Aquimarina sp. 2201CG5-10]